MANPDLLNYIDQARKAGSTDEQIRQGLLQSGWQANDVNDALMKAPMAPVPGLGGRPMMSKTLLILLAVAALAVGGYFAGAYYMANYQNFYLWPYEAEVPVPTFTPRPSPTPTPSPTATPDPTAGWKTYTNTQYGFEVRYPADWLFDNSPAKVYKFSDTITGPNQQCSVTLTFGGPISPKTDKVNHYNDINDGEKCDAILNQIIATFKLIQ